MLLLNNYSIFSKSSNEEMTLSDFKFIWTMEYLHRMWGRGIGLAFLIPCAYFWYRGRFNRQMKIRMGLAGLLICAQVIVKLVAFIFVFRELSAGGWSNQVLIPDKIPIQTFHASVNIV